MSQELPPGELTLLLGAFGKGGVAEEQLFEVLMQKLEKHASRLLACNSDLRRKKETKELVNDVYVRLRQTYDKRGGLKFESRAQFFSLAAQTMHHVLMDLVKKGGQQRLKTEMQVPLSSIDVATHDERTARLLDLDRALGKLEALNPKQAEALRLHYMIGWTLDESADLMDMGTATLKRQLSDARDWVEEALTP